MTAAAPLSLPHVRRIRAALTDLSLGVTRTAAVGSKSEMDANKTSDKVIADSLVESCPTCGAPPNRWCAGDANDGPIPGIHAARSGPVTATLLRRANALVASLEARQRTTAAKAR